MSVLHRRSSLVALIGLLPLLFVIASGQQGRAPNNQPPPQRADIVATTQVPVPANVVLPSSAPLPGEGEEGPLSLPFLSPAGHQFDCEAEQRAAAQIVGRRNAGGGGEAENNETETAPNWQEQLEEKRANYSQELQQCRDTVANSNTNSTEITDFLDYEADLASCPDSRSTWKTLAIVFLVGFVLALVLAGALAALYFKNVKGGGTRRR